MTALQTSTATDPLVRERASNGRRAAFVVAFVLLATVLLAWLGSGAKQGFLNPAAFDGSGSHAVATLLEDNGVRVVTVNTAALASSFIDEDPANTTLLVAVPDLLREGQVATLTSAGAATTVLVAPTTPTALSAWAPAVAPVGSATNETREPLCSWRPAELAGGARAGGVAYRVGTVPVGEVAQECYPFDSDPTVVHLQHADGSDVTVLGDPLILTNDQLARDGNAALALNTLGQHATVVWYLPSLTELDAGASASFFDLVPKAITFAILQLVVAIVLLALWRARRLGPVVVEPLPVVVRSSETVEGRGRLYRQAKARDRAAAALRNGTLNRLRLRAGLPPQSTPDMLVAALEPRCSLAAPSLRGLLYGPAPTDDAALVALADDLDSLEREVNRT